MTRERANMIILSPQDNVGIALRDIAAGSRARDRQGKSLHPLETIPQGHKIALTAIASGDAIIRFSMPIGIATREIAPGALVHVQNVASQYLNNDQDHYE